MIDQGITKDQALKEVLNVCRRLSYYKHSEEDLKIELKTLKTAITAYDELPARKRRR